MVKLASQSSLNRARFVRGATLSLHVQEQAKRRFVHRFTGDHRPKWAEQVWQDGRAYPLQFANDSEWLEHTFFAVTLAGFLDERVDHCHSQPTWPHNPELRPPSTQGSLRGSLEGLSLRGPLREALRLAFEASL